MIKTENQRLGHRVVLALGLFAMIAVGCDSSAMDAETDPVEILDSLELIDEVQMTKMDTREGQEDEFLLEVTLREEPDVRYPSAINLLGLSREMPSTLLADNGIGADAEKGDRVYSGVVPESCVPGGVPLAGAAKDVVTITISCDWDLIRPGEECEGYGTCPSTAQRSWLWGLIEYETNVVTCWCRGGCEFDIEFSL